MTRQAVLVGGPRDGATVPFMGLVYREPVPVGRTYIQPDTPPPREEVFCVLTYDFRWWWTGSERAARYVLRSGTDAQVRD